MRYICLGEMASKKLFEEGLRKFCYCCLYKPIGIMSANDELGRYIIEVCKISKIKVPEEVSVIGVENDELICKLTDPPLTSIILDFAKAGYEAAHLLHKMINTGRKKTGIIQIKPVFVKKRGS